MGREHEGVGQASHRHDRASAGKTPGRKVAPGPPDDRTSGGECMKLTKVGAIAASAVFVFAACSPAPGGSAAPAASGSGAAAAQPEVCKNKKGTSANEIHVYSSLPRQGSNTEQTNALVESIKERSEERRVGKECRSGWWPYH